MVDDSWSWSSPVVAGEPVEVLAEALAQLWVEGHRGRLLRAAVDRVHASPLLRALARIEAERQVRDRQEPAMDDAGFGACLELVRRVSAASRRERLGRASALR